jgi:subtilisin family serine protease
MSKGKNKYVIIISFIVCVITYVIINLNGNVEKYDWIVDEQFGKQWYLLNNGVCSDIILDKEFCQIKNFKKGIDINIKPNWGKSTKVQNNNEIIIAVIDTGVDYDHEDLINNIWINEGEIPLDGMDNDNNGYDYDTGASMSTAMVTGVAALLYIFHGNEVSPENVKQSICKSVTQLENLEDKVRTCGMLNVESAIEYYDNNFN